LQGAQNFGVDFVDVGRWVGVEIALIHAAVICVVKVDEIGDKC
jgi:hypothetical protein